MFVWGYAKVLLASLVTGAAVMLAVSAWQLRHGGDRDVFTRSARLALMVLVPAILFTMLVGDELGVIEAKYQPMKIAAACPLLATDQLELAGSVGSLLYTLRACLYCGTSRKELPPARRGRHGPARPAVQYCCHMNNLVPFWFLVIAVLWTGFFILEGFNAGEGGLLSRSGRYTIRLLSRSRPSLGGDVLPGAGRLEWRGLAEADVRGTC